MQHNACKLVVAGGEESPPSIAGAPLGRIRVAPRSLSYSPVSKFRRTKVQNPTNTSLCCISSRLARWLIRPLGRITVAPRSPHHSSFSQNCTTRNREEEKEEKTQRQHCCIPLRGRWPPTTYHSPVPWRELGLHLHITAFVPKKIEEKGKLKDFVFEETK